ncbi:MAG: hypothetical protein WC853_03820 [Thermodesulfovibrionales bacterium]
MKELRIRCAALSAIILLIITSTATAATIFWKDDSYQQEPFKKVFVLVTLQDPTLKRQLEDEFSKQLNNHGTDSVESYPIFSSHSLSDKESITLKIKELEAEAIFIIRLMRVEKEDTTSSANNYVVPTWYHDWYKYYSSGFKFIRIPTYTDDNYLVIAETNIYETPKKRLIWAARSDMFTVSCGCQELISFINVIIDKLSSDHLIK